MGASEWAGRMIEWMHEEFGVDLERAIQITNRVRKVAANPDWDSFRDVGFLDESFNRTFISNLIESISEQEGKTLESGWNNLVREFSLFDILGDDILLYDPAKSRFDETQTLVSEAGDSITV